MNKELRKAYHMDDNSICYFSTQKFARVIREIRRECNEQGRKSKQDFFEDIAEKTGISASSLHHWEMGHNAPSDLEKISLIAGALGIDMSEILETVDEKNVISRNEEKTMENRDIMKTVIMPLGECVNQLDTKSILREIYHEIVDYIEVFRTTLAFEYDCDPFGNLVEVHYASNQYKKILHMIRKSMLDVPNATYKNLLAYTKGYLLNMMGDEFEPIDIWDIRTWSEDELKDHGVDMETLNPYHRKFVGYVNFQKEYDGPEVQLEYVLRIADTAYELVEEILAEYILK